MEAQGTAPVEQTSDSVNQSDQSAAKDFVSLETHRRLLDEKKKQKALLDELLAKEKMREEEEARKRGDFQKIELGLKEELEVERQKRISLENMFTNGRKLNAVTEALGGNIEPKWLKLLDVNDIVVHPETGEVDHMSVAKVAEAFRKEFPEAIKKGPVLPSQHPQGVQGGSGRIAESEWKKLKSLSEMNKWKRDQIVWGQ